MAAPYVDVQGRTKPGTQAAEYVGNLRSGRVVTDGFRKLKVVRQYEGSTLVERPRPDALEWDEGLLEMVARPRGAERVTIARGTIVFPVAERRA